MPRYQYTAVNQQNKKLSGVIDAITEASARHELNLIGLSILNLEEIHEDTTAQKTATLPKWKFEAFDLDGKKIIGSIRGEDTFLAYQRLTDEYNFKVLAIYPENANEDEIRTARATEIHNLENLYLENKKKLEKPQRDNLESFQQRREKLLKEADKIVKETQERLVIHQESLQPDAISNIKKEINKLLRLKTSSNLEYIEQICTDLLKTFQDPHIFKDPEKSSPDRTETIIRAKLLEKSFLRYNKKNRSVNASILTSIKTWQAQNISDSKEPPFTTTIINAILEAIYRLFYEKKEIQNIKIKLQENTTALMDHAKIWFSGTKKEKALVLPILKNLWVERIELKSDLKKEKYIGKTTSSPYVLELHAPNILSALLEESVIFTGWLLLFYLLYYFVAIYTRTKNFGSDFFENWYLFESKSFRYAFALLFLLHAILSIKKTFFTKNAAFSLLMVPLLIGTTLFLIYNF